MNPTFKDSLINCNNLKTLAKLLDPEPTSQGEKSQFISKTTFLAGRYFTRTYYGDSIDFKTIIRNLHRLAHSSLSEKPALQIEEEVRTAKNIFNRIKALDLEGTQQLENKNWITKTIFKIRRFIESFYFVD